MPAASVRAQIDEVRVAARGHRGPQALDHLGGRNDGLAVEVSASLGVDLVLEVAAGQPGVLEQRDGARGVHRFAESGVGVDQRGQVGDRRDLRAASGDLGQRGQPDVGQSQVGGQHRARDVDALESDLGDKLGHQRRERAREPLQPT